MPEFITAVTQQEKQPPMTVKIRKIKDKEFTESQNLSKYAFGFWSDDEPQPNERARYGFDPDEYIAAFVDSTIAAKVRNRPFEQIIRGVMKPMGGIAAVASYPKYRRRGLIRQLMLAAFEDMRQKGQVVSALYPFRENFYTQFGYATTNNHMTAVVETNTLSHYLPLLKQNEGEWTIERHRARDVQAEWLGFSREMASKYHGSVYYSKLLADPYWQRQVKDQHVVFVRENSLPPQRSGGRLVAAARFHIKGYMETGKIAVRDWHWQTLAARDRLFGYFATHADTVPTLKFPMPYGTNFHAWIRQPTVGIKVEINFVVHMGRVIDVVGALANLPAPIDGTIVIEVEDEQCRWNNDTYELVGDNGRLHATRTQKTASCKADILTLSSMVYGTLSIAELQHRGWLTEKSSDFALASSLLNNWFPPKLIFNTNTF